MERLRTRHGGAALAHLNFQDKTPAVSLYSIPLGAVRHSYLVHELLSRLRRRGCWFIAGATCISRVAQCCCTRSTHVLARRRAIGHIPSRAFPCFQLPPESCVWPRTRSRAAHELFGSEHNSSTPSGRLTATRTPEWLLMLKAAAIAT